MHSLGVLRLVGNVTMSESCAPRAHMPAASLPYRYDSMSALDMFRQFGITKSAYEVRGQRAKGSQHCSVLQPAPPQQAVTAVHRLAVPATSELPEANAAGGPVCAARGTQRRCVGQGEERRVEVAVPVACTAACIAVGSRTLLRSGHKLALLACLPRSRGGGDSVFLRAGAPGRL